MPITLADRQLIVARMDKQFNEGYFRYTNLNVFFGKKFRFLIVL